MQMMQPAHEMVGKLCPVLSRFGTGTYILRITDPDGQRNERVVVE